jgi:hypothetical protein
MALYLLAWVSAAGPETAADQAGRLWLQPAADIAGHDGGCPGAATSLVRVRVAE